MVLTHDARQGFEVMTHVYCQDWGESMNWHMALVELGWQESDLSFGNEKKKKNSFPLSTHRQYIYTHAIQILEVIYNTTHNIYVTCGGIIYIHICTS